MPTRVTTTSSCWTVNTFRQWHCWSYGPDRNLCVELPFFFWMEKSDAKRHRGKSLGDIHLLYFKWKWKTVEKKSYWKQWSIKIYFFLHARRFMEFSMSSAYLFALLQEILHCTFRLAAMERINLFQKRIRQHFSFT